MQAQISDYMETLLSPFLCGYLKGYSVQLALLSMLEKYRGTKINTSYSSWSELLVGVPHGSVLGPIVFNLFINNLFYIIKTYICNYAEGNNPYTIDVFR